MSVHLKKEIIIQTHLTGKRANLILLILASQRIGSRAEQNGRYFDIHVDCEDVDLATAAISAYFQENRSGRFIHPSQAVPLSSFHSPAAYGLMIIITLIHLLCIRFRVHDQIIYQYGASALFILKGETFRAITALFLHADARHLLGNLAGIILFVAPVLSLSGYGTGSFILLFSGTLGNLCNAYLYRTAHISIGASTMIMAAAGLLAAFQFTIKRPFRFNNLFPVAAGAVLVALFSHGERTDVWAHVFGFVCGLLSGIFFFPLNRTVRVKHKHKVFLILTLIILGAAAVCGTGLL